MQDSEELIEHGILTHAELSSQEGEQVRMANHGVPPSKSHVKQAAPESQYRLGYPWHVKVVIALAGLFLVGLSAYAFWPVDSWEKDNIKMLTALRSEVETAIAAGDDLRALAKSEEILNLAGDRKLNLLCLRDIVEYASKMKVECSNRIVIARYKREEDARRKAEEEKRQAEILRQSQMKTQEEQVRQAESMRVLKDRDKKILELEAQIKNLKAQAGQELAWAKDKIAALETENANLKQEISALRANSAQTGASERLTSVPLVGDETPLGEVQASPQDYVGVPFILMGGLGINEHFRNGYERSRGTHVSFTLEAFSSRAGITEGIAGRQVTIQSAHGARHLTGTRLTSGTVESAIRTQVQQATTGASATGSFWGRVPAGGQVIEYRAFTLPNGTINVGTYYPVTP